MAHSIETLESRIAPATLIAATSNNELLTFDSSTPGTVETIAITGFLGTAGETLVGIDFRPATGGFYGLTVNDASQGQLYQINPLSGTATPIGIAFTDMNLTLPKTAGYGFDFNPTVDRIRVVNSVGENFRLNPLNGVIAGVDTDLTAGAMVHGSAYDRSFFGATATTLFGIDVNTDQLVLQGSVNATPNSPNGGVITNVGPLGVDAASASFDIENGTGLGYAALQVGGTTGLYTVNLITGAATSVGSIGTGTSTIVGVAAATEQIEILNPKTARYTDVDGDIVTIKITKGELTPGIFELAAGPNGGAVLRLLSLRDSSFTGTNVSITAQPGSGGGDKLATVGYISAAGVDLGNVKIAGDLTQIDAGDMTGGIGLKSLSVDSFGRTKLSVNAVDTVSAIEGSLTKLVVKKDFTNFTLSVSDGTVNSLGRIGSIVIGGSIVGGTDSAAGNIDAEQIGNVKIGADLVGGTAANSGRITSSDVISSINIGGSFIGGSADNAGRISAGVGLNKIAIKESIIGGSGPQSARIDTEGDIGSIIVGQSFIGGSAEGAASIFGGGKVGLVSVKQSILGGAGSGSASISAGELTKLSVGNDVIGSGITSASLLADKVGAINIGGNLNGSGSMSAIISAEDLGTVSITGSVIGTGMESARITASNLNSITIKGSLTGSATNAGVISAGTLNKVVINGNLNGVDGSSGRIATEGSLGTVAIKGTIQGGSISSSIDIADIKVDGDVSGSSGSESVIAANGTIDSISIKGSLRGGIGSTGNIFATTITKISVGGDIAASFIGAENAVGSVTVKGSLLGTTISATAGISSINVGRDIVGALIEGGAIFSNGQVDSIVVKGSIQAGDTGANIITGVLGSLKVGGDVAGTSTHRIIISGLGTQATSGSTDVAIQTITVGGRVESTQILAGYLGIGSNADAQIGSISVGGDWISSDAVAGIGTENGQYGDDDDFIIGEVGQVSGIVASIASITIKGTVLGTFGGTDSFAFTAEEIKSLSIAGKKIQLQSGPSNDDLFAPGATQDIRIRELGVI